MAPLNLLKLVIKKLAAIRGALYFMFLAPPDNPGSDAEIGTSKKIYDQYDLY